MPELYSQAYFEDAAATIRRQTQLRPRIGLILGSGLGPLADAVEEAVGVPYGEIPHFPVSTVGGHVGRLILGWSEGQAVVVMQGRAHYYEGYSMAEVTFPVRVMQVLGIETLIVTNAAGGLNSEFQAGDVMLITDHINMVGLGGSNPLRGPNLDEFGPRFPDMTSAYDVCLREVAKQAAAEAGVSLREGVYACVAGPSFETPAELRFLRLIGADAVGMSTVHEVIVARHGGISVLGLSGISNLAPVEGKPSTKTTHEEVLETGKILAPQLEAIIRGVLRAL